MRADGQKDDDDETNGQAENADGDDGAVSAGQMADNDRTDDWTDRRMG